MFDEVDIFQDLAFKNDTSWYKYSTVFKDLFHDIHIHVQPLNKCHHLVLSFKNILNIVGNALLWQL